MNLKKISIALTTLVTALTIMAGPALAVAASPTRVRAMGNYYAAGYYLNLTANSDQTGNIQNVTPSGDAYIAKVSCAVFQNNMAWVAAKLKLQTNPSWGPWIVLKLVDNGDAPLQPTDVLYAQFTDQTTAMNMCNTMQTPAGGPWPMLLGDIKVQ